jgi:hypothetical protein
MRSSMASTCFVGADRLSGRLRHRAGNAEQSCDDGRLLCRPRYNGQKLSYVYFEDEPGR